MPLRRLELFALVALALLAIFLPSQARAQIQTFYYSGPAFNLTDCLHSSPPCIAGGSVNGSITYWGVSSNYTGYVHLNQVIASTESATGFGTLGFSNATEADLYLNNGSVEAWDWVSSNNPASPNIVIGASDVGDSGTITASGTITKQGVANQPPYGTWFSPIALGAPCAAEAPSDAPPLPGKGSCGVSPDPVDIGSGNMFLSVPDYATVGQNPLAFTRYYNSFSVPDTYAVTLGSNWRHTFDRYLHIINPSAIYGVTVERETGQYINFSSSSGTYTPDSDVDYSLSKSGSACGSSTWTLTDPDDTVETYCQSGAEATLQSITRRNGYTQTPHYSSAGLLTSVTDTYGRTLGLSYSSAGLLTGLTTPDAPTFAFGYVGFSSGGHLLSTVTYNTSPATQQGYTYFTSSSQLAGITDENGHLYSSWTYDSSGRMATSQLAGGVNFTSVSYFDDTGDRHVTGPLGIQEKYQFDVLQGVPKVVEIDRAANGTVAAASEFFDYDSSGYLADAFDWNDNETSYTNNSHGLPTQIVFASGSSDTHTTNITYDGTWARLAYIITEPGLTTTLNRDANGNVTTRVEQDTTTTTTPYSTNGQTRTWTYTYTSSGQYTSIRLPRTDVYAKTAYGYSGGVLNFTSDALGHTITANTFTPGGRWTKFTDQNGVQTQLSYSSRLWLTSSVLLTSAGNLTTSLQYDSAGEYTKFTRPDGSYLSFAYDNAHRPITITNALGETANFTFNSASNLTQTLWKNSGGTTKRQHSATFDALGRMLTDVGGASQTTTFGYDDNSNTTSITDPLSHVTTQTFDALNRVHTVTDAATDLTTTTYDAHDRPLTVTDPKGNATSHVYDGWGDMIQQTSPDSGTTVFWYDPDSNPTTKKDASIQYTSATYDALDRPLTRTYPADSSLNVAYTYDQTGHGKGIGHLTSQTDQAGSLSLSWEERGLLTSSVRTISSTAYTTGYTYESAGRYASITYPTAGWVVKYFRDAAGQVTSVTDTQPSHSPVNLATSITHMPFGPVSGFTYGNGVTDTRTFDQDYRMTSVKDVGTSGNIQYLSYGYDADSNPTSITDNVTSGHSQTLTFDVLDRLKSAVGSYGTISSITYDSNSNRLTYGGTSYTVPSGSDKMSAVGANAITYTSTGNMTGVGASTSMTYSKANKLASITVSGTTTAFTYGADGYRLTDKTGTNPAVVYRYDQGGPLLSESRSTETDYAYLDGFPIATIRPSTAAVSAIHTDMLGTPMKATDSSQTLNWALSMNPNGGGSPSPNSITQSLRWPGMHGDAAGYFSNGERTYQPISIGGRYLEGDPLGLAGAIIGSGGGTNIYPYGGNNPFRNSDPSGLCIEDACIVEGILVAEAAAEVGAEVAAVIEATEAAETGAAVAEGEGGLPIAAPPPAIEPPAATPGAQCTVSGPPGLTAAEQLAENRAAGAAFEQVVGANLEQSGLDIGQQITIETQSGVRTRLDFLTKDPVTGEIGCVECKASSTAPLTPNQSLAFPEIEQTGGTIVGAGKPGFPGGSQIPPTSVQILRGQ